jgi:ATP-binding cassette subfamily C protein
MQWVKWAWSLRRSVDRRHYLRAAYTVIGMVLISLLEIAGIGAIFPLMVAMVDPDRLAKLPLVSTAYSWLGSENQVSFVLFMAAGLLGLIVIKAIATIFSYRWQFIFAYDIQWTLSTRLLKTYLLAPYSFHLNRNTADMLRNIQSEIPVLANGVLIPSLQILGESIVFLAIVLFLGAISPILTIVMALVLSVTVPTVLRLTKKQSEKHAAQRRRAVTNMYRVASAGLSGFKDLKVLGRQNSFIKRYELDCKDYCQSNAHIMLMGQMPRLVMEVLIFIGLLGVLAYVVYTTGETKSALPLLGLYAVAATRLMPSLNKIVVGVMQIRYYRGLLDMLPQIIGNITQPDKASQTNIRLRIPFEREIRITGLSYAYPGAKTNTLSDISLTIPKGKSVAIIGPSGAGKTTLADVILGLLDEYQGSVKIDNTELSKENMHSWQSCVGYVPQNVYLADDTLLNNVAFGVPDNEIVLASVQKAIGVAQLSDVVSLLPQKWDTFIGERGIKLSGGQRQRIGIARALYREPEVLLMDEATSALDGLTEREIAQEIELLAGKSTVIIIAHRLSTIRKCDIIFVLEGGRLTGAGSYNELSQSNDYFSQVAAAEKESVVSNSAAIR